LRGRGINSGRRGGLHLLFSAHRKIRAQPKPVGVRLLAILNITTTSELCTDL
jgi:hypothetical protein